MAKPFRNYDDFCNEVLRSRAGPLSSPVEDMADEMYHQEFTDEFDSMWDSMDSDEE